MLAVIEVVVTAARLRQLIAQARRQRPEVPSDHLQEFRVGHENNLKNVSDPF
jgi:hypothetical protein